MPDTTTTPLLTRAHIDQARDNLNTVEIAYRELASTQDIATRTRDTTGRGSTGHTRPSPSPGVDHADDIMRTLRDAEDALREWLGHDPNRLPIEHDAAGTTVRNAATYLRRYEQEIWTAPFAETYTKELARLAGQSETLRGGGTGKEDWCVYRGAICPACHAERLKQLAGTDQLQCRDCGARGTVAEVEGYREHLRRGGQARTAVA